MARTLEPTDLVFISGRRTPFGAFGGTLKDLTPADLGVAASSGALRDAGVDPREVEHVIFGQVLQPTADSIYTPRHIGLRTGIPKEIPALGVNRLCGSGFEAVVQAQLLMRGEGLRLALVGGTESMSQAPYVVRGARFGLRMGSKDIEDSLTSALYDPIPKAPMAITAENLAKRYSINRQESDAYAMRSQELAARAKSEGKFKDEIEPTSPGGKPGTPLLSEDEHPRPSTTPETLAKLKTVFLADGVVTAGNASGIVDGAAALIVMTSAEAKRRGLRPFARLVSSASVGCEPSEMGIGPVPAIQLALRRGELSLADIDLFEVNEAFAPQTLAVQRELKLPLDRLNINGGAIAIGHPLGASGARITVSMMKELRRRSGRFGVVSACIGGGQGIALVLEHLNS